MITAHYCPEHQSKFFRNEKTADDGHLKVWYSHKKMDGTGFCVEKDNVAQQTTLLQPVSQESNSGQKMLMCNAMNNAVQLAVNSKISVDQIGTYYHKILGAMNRTTN